VGSRIEVDATGATAVSGVWVAGNLADVQAQVITSAASGLVAGAAINADLITEETRRAVDARRDIRDGQAPVRPSSQIVRHTTDQRPDDYQPCRTQHLPLPNLTHLGDTYHASGDPEAARHAWQQALEILDDMHHPDASDARTKLRILP
jgi:hypothetical protein